jgi:hypothetical protein
MLTIKALYFVKFMLANRLCCEHSLAVIILDKAGLGRLRQYVHRREMKFLQFLDEAKWHSH